MNIINAGLLVIGSLILIGCSTSKQSNQTEPSAIPTATAPQAIVAEPTPAVVEPEKIRRPRRAKLPTTEQPTESMNIPEPTIANPQPVVATEATSEWHPNEAHLARGSELIMGLQHDIGRQPSGQEMQNRLQTHMGLSSTQAQKVIATLGLR